MASSNIEQTSSQKQIDAARSDTGTKYVGLQYEPSTGGWFAPSSGLTTPQQQREVELWQSVGAPPTYSAEQSAAWKEQAQQPIVKPPVSVLDITTVQRPQPSIMRQAAERAPSPFFIPARTGEPARIQTSPLDVYGSQTTTTGAPSIIGGLKTGQRTATLKETSLENLFATFPKYSQDTTYPEMKLGQLGGIPFSIPPTTIKREAVAVPESTAIAYKLETGKELQSPVQGIGLLEKIVALSGYTPVAPSPVEIKSTGGAGVSMREKPLAERATEYGKWLGSHLLVGLAETAELPFVVARKPVETIASIPTGLIQTGARLLSPEAPGAAAEIAGQRIAAKGFQLGIDKLANLINPPTVSQSVELGVARIEREGEVTKGQQVAKVITKVGEQKFESDILSRFAQKGGTESRPTKGVSISEVLTEGAGKVDESLLATKYVSSQKGGLTGIMAESEIVSRPTGILERLKSFITGEKFTTERAAGKFIGRELLPEEQGGLQPGRYVASIGETMTEKGALGEARGLVKIEDIVRTPEFKPSVSARPSTVTVPLADVVDSTILRVVRDTAVSQAGTPSSLVGSIISAGISTAAPSVAQKAKQTQAPSIAQSVGQLRLPSFDVIQGQLTGTIGKQKERQATTPIQTTATIGDMKKATGQVVIPGLGIITGQTPFQNFIQGQVTGTTTATKTDLTTPELGQPGTPPSITKLIRLPIGEPGIRLPDITRGIAQTKPRGGYRYGEKVWSGVATGEQFAQMLTGKTTAQPKIISPKNPPFYSVIGTPYEKSSAKVRYIVPRETVTKTISAGAGMFDVMGGSRQPATRTRLAAVSPMRQIQRVISGSNYGSSPTARRSAVYPSRSSSRVIGLTSSSVGTNGTMKRIRKLL